MNFLTASTYDSIHESLGLSSRKRAARWESIAYPSLNVPTWPSTAHAPRQPPYMAPVTDGKNASLPASQRPGISVRGFVVHCRFIGENISGTHLIRSEECKFTSYGQRNIKESSLLTWYHKNLLFSYIKVLNKLIRYMQFNTLHSYFRMKVYIWYKYIPVRSQEGTLAKWCAKVIVFNPSLHLRYKLM